MKTIIFFLLSLTLCSGNVNRPLKGEFKLTLAEAERILGESCKLGEVKDSVFGENYQYKSTYIANAGGEKSKPITLYYMFEVYKEEAETKEIFDGFRVGNQNHKGFGLRKNLGDEAFFHSDGKNFDLLVVRKGNKMIRFKVNKISSKTSQEELNKIALDIIKRV
jgi:hypothetical protein